ncbi:MAG TPA: tetratricopeptide repeat protein [Candidatus Angelobacter sp.]|jgi:tetratricopeptide (TPR) repeat protein|nr:tetratricopeptide repeat protein [Candidatus Angelobacter sp.]
MRLAAVVTFLVFIVTLPAGAGELKGIVFENEVGGRPVSGVAITSPGANPATTDTGGQFKLIFPNKKPGNTVQIVVEKTGYVVVNDIQLEQTLAANPDEKLMRILISKPTSREEMARRYYRLKSLEAIEAKYKALLKENQSNALKMVQLQQERDQAIKAAEQTAEELAKTKPRQTSELYNRAMRLFLDGEIDQALKILNEDQLDSDLVAAQQRKVEAESAIEQTAQSWVLKGRLLTLEFRFEEADQAYRKAVHAAPRSFDVNFDYAYFNQELNRYFAARQAYERCLEIAKGDHNEASVAKALNNLGKLYNDHHRLDEARQALDEALKISRGLARKDPEVYMPYLAATLGNLGILHHTQNRMEEAGQAYDEVLKVYRELARKNPDTYPSYVASTLNNLGNLRRDQNRLVEARRAYDEALKTYRELARKNPESYLPDMAATLNNLGGLDRDQNRTEEALQAYNEALKISRGLAQKNPDTYLPDMALTLNNLGILLLDRDRMEEARQAYDEALTIRRELARKNPESYLPDMAVTLNNLGGLDRTQNRMEEARQAYNEALKIRRELAQKNPDTYLPDLADTLVSLGILESNQNHIEEARQAFQEALTIYQRFAATNPEQFRSKVTLVEKMLRELKVSDN